MRRHLFVLAIALGGAVLASATTVSYIDPFGSNATSCDNSSCDVIGDKRFFDLERLSLTVDVANQTATLSISLNFGDDTLAGYMYGGIRLDAADVLFKVGGSIRYGVALTSHAGSPNGGPAGLALDAGHLYTVENSSGTMTAFDVLQATNAVYRPGYSVWLRNDGQGSVVDAGSGTVQVAHTGDGVTSGRLTVTVAFTPTSQFMNDFQLGALGIQFASATCGNDILPAQPVHTEVPEAGTPVLIASGLAAMARRRYKGQLAAATIRPVFGS